jgi:asparagine synthase (glutamine-hydrolysing)
LVEKHNASSLISTEKLGFNVNTLNLWKAQGHDLCKEFFDNSELVKAGWINKEWIVKYIDNPDLNVKYVNKFLGLLACEVWYRLFITKNMNSEETLD